VPGGWGGLCRLDQGSAASHSCPSCRRSLRPSTEAQGPTAAEGNGQPGQAQPGEAQTWGPLTWVLDQVVQWAQPGQGRQEQAPVNTWAAGAQGVGRPQGPGAGEGALGQGQVGVGGLGPAGGVPRPSDGGVAEGGGAGALRPRGFALSFPGLRFRGGRGSEGRERGGAGGRVVGRMWGNWVGRVAGEREGRHLQVQRVRRKWSRGWWPWQRKWREILPHVPFTTILHVSSSPSHIAPSGDFSGELSVQNRKAEKREKRNRGGA